MNILRFWFIQYTYADQDRYLICRDPHCFWNWIRIRIRIRVKSCIHIRTQIRNKIKMQKLSRLKMEPRRAVEAQNRGLEGLYARPGGRRYLDETQEQDPDPH